MKKRKSGVMLRKVSAGIIDVLLIIFALFLLTVVVADPLADVFFNTSRNAKLMNEIKQNYTLSEDMGYQGEKEFVFFTTSKDYVDFKLNEYKKEHGLDIIDEEKEIELKTKYEVVYEQNKERYTLKLESDQEYISLSNKQRAIDYGIFLFTTLVSEIFFLYLIPFHLIKGQTLGMKMQGLYFVDKNNVLSTYKRGIIYFLVIYLIETVLVYTILGLDIILLIPILNLIVILFNKSRQTLHGLISGIKVVDYALEPVFKNISESINYKNKYETT